MTFEAGMNSMSSVPSPRRTLTAFFDTRADAQVAVDAIKAVGVATSDIQVVEGSASDEWTSEVRPYRELGFWQSLKNLFMPEEDRHTYAEGLRRGGYLVTVQGTDANYDIVSEIFDREGTVDLDGRAEEWRSSGWTGPETTLSGTHPDITTASAAGTTGAPGVLSDRFSAPETPPVVVSGIDRDTSPRSDQAIPIAEDRLNVGKRDVNESRVRVRSYVAESPLQEDNLRDEKATIERRSADRSMDTFRTGKGQDTVRKTEAEIKDERAADIHAANTNPAVRRDA